MWALSLFSNLYSQEMGDFFILVRSGMTYTQAVVVNFLCALTALLGKRVNDCFYTLNVQGLLRHCAGGRGR